MGARKGNRFLLGGAIVTALVLLYTLSDSTPAPKLVVQTNRYLHVDERTPNTVAVNGVPGFRGSLMYALTDFRLLSEFIFEKRSLDCCC
jgi:hypothetical protein